MESNPLFNSFIQGGFECSTHIRKDGSRLDLIRSTSHDIYVKDDYLALNSHGIHTVRDGLRWHLIEHYPGYFDWSSFLPMLRAANESDTQVIWDLCHYGWPDGIDIWKPEFVTHFAKFAKAAAQIIKNETDGIPFYCPINEISFWSWAGGDVAYFNPHQYHRGFELKHQLIRATIAAIDAIREVDPRARFIQAEPLINVIPGIGSIAEAEAYNESQFQAYDMLSGKIWPGLGGQPDMLDIIGANYYPYNQWFLHGDRIDRHHSQYKPLWQMLGELYQRYRKPLFIAETGAEGDERIQWFKYILAQVEQCLIKGTPIKGICLYPIVDYPGWDDERHCQTGLLSLVLAKGFRSHYEPLVEEIRAYQLLNKSVSNINTRTLTKSPITTNQSCSILS
ncbi:MAG: beta-glucosidase [Burkholderiales bacterium]|nr:beta-glucosidase [Burkholderiales bacterium]